MSVPSKKCSILGCLFSPRLYGALVGFLSLWAMISSLTASFYLLTSFHDIKDVPESLKTYYQYALLDVIMILVGIVIVGIYLIGIYKANEHCLTPFIVLLVLDFMGYIASEASAHWKGSPLQHRWKKNLLEILVFSCIFTIVVHLHRLFQYQRQLQKERLVGYRSIYGSAENIAM